MSGYKRIEHTPGPWFPSRQRDGVCAIINPRTVKDAPSTIRYYGGHLVCESMGNRGDKAIVCTAPDMYEILRDLHDWLGQSAIGPQALRFHERITELLHEQWKIAELER